MRSAGRDVLDAQRQQREDDDEERDAVQRETERGAEGRERGAGEQRTEYARQVELNRVQRDRVGQILLSRRASAPATDTPGRRRPGEAGDERQREDLPDLDLAPEHQRRQRQRRRHLHVLRGEQQAPAIVTIGDDAADQRQAAGSAAARGSRRGPGRTTDLVSSRMSQLCATFCIHVPTVEVKAPNHRSAEIAIGERREGAAENRLQRQAVQY